MKADEINAAVGGILTGNKDIAINAVCTDSRKMIMGGLFVALSGDNFDGNEYIGKAYENGAEVAIGTKKVRVPDDKAFILVPDTKAALMELASYYRDKFDIQLVGLTGSVGKTTTKEMIYRVLSEKYHTHKTSGNFNNDIGVPLTLLGLNEEHEAAVIEMGMNHQGEISKLTRCAKPTVALITNIGVTHIGNLGSRENILKAKLEITEGLKEGKTLILNGDDEYLKTVRLDGARIKTFGFKNNCDIKGEITGEREFEVMGETVHMPIGGEHNMYNALAAIAVGLECGVSVKKAVLGIEKYETDDRRQYETVIGDGIKVICDYYNSSPTSVEASLALLKSGECKRRIAVLGDMLELGDIAEECHRETGIKAAKSGVDILLTLGELSVYTAEGAMEAGIGEAVSFDDAFTLSEYLRKIMKKGDLILIKGSRGMKMERIFEKIR